MRFESLGTLIGHTPMIPLTRLTSAPAGQILAKLECCNPGGSSKDRIARAMLDRAEAEGRLFPDSTVIEPTSGNTGVALAMLCACRGYRCIIVMPDSMSRERQLLMEAYGAQVLRTPGSAGMSGAVREAEALAARIPHSFLPNQFQNPANPAAHYATTGPEIWADTRGNVDILVAGVGTGGTLTGTARYLKERNPALKTVVVEPAGSPLLSTGQAGRHGIQGIGPDFIPDILDRGLIDRIFPVTDTQAVETTRLLARQEGILAGISAGAAAYAAVSVAQQPDNRGKTLVVILPDTGTRYLSTPVFQGG